MIGDLKYRFHGALTKERWSLNIIGSRWKQLRSFQSYVGKNCQRFSIYTEWIMAEVSGVFKGFLHRLSMEDKAVVKNKRKDIWTTVKTDPEPNHILVKCP